MEYTSTSIWIYSLSEDDDSREKKVTMTTQRRTNNANGPLLPVSQNDITKTNNRMGLMEKWRERKAKLEKGETQMNGHIYMKIMICFHAPTYIYVMMNYIVPYFFEDFHPWTQYYFKVFLWFILMNVLVNFICTIAYSSFYIQTKDNPYWNLHQRANHLPETFCGRLEQETDNQSNGGLPRKVTTKDGELDWSVCKKCNVTVPPRTYHCNFCKKCVLKRDHHCFVVGCCVGFKNQRYFIVMLLYCLIIGVLGEYLTVVYFKHELWPTTTSWINLILPVTVVRWVLGHIPAFDTLLIFHCYIYALYILLGVAYFPSQVVFAMQGRTLLEVAKNIPIKNSNPWKRNLTSVFGECWVLNFIFPMVLIFRQPDDGVHWQNVKIDHNSNKILKESEMPVI